MYRDVARMQIFTSSVWNPIDVKENADLKQFHRFTIYPVPKYSTYEVAVRKKSPKKVREQLSMSNISRNYDFRSLPPSHNKPNHLHFRHPSLWPVGPKCRPLGPLRTIKWRCPGRLPNVFDRTDDDLKKERAAAAAGRLIVPRMPHVPLDRLGALTFRTAKKNRSFDTKKMLPLDVQQSI